MFFTNATLLRKKNTFCPSAARNDVHKTCGLCCGELLWGLCCEDLLWGRRVSRRQRYRGRGRLRSPHKPVGAMGCNLVRGRFGAIKYDDLHLGLYGQFVIIRRSRPFNSLDSPIVIAHYALRIAHCLSCICRVKCMRLVCD